MPGRGGVPSSARQNTVQMNNIARQKLISELENRMLRLACELCILRSMVELHATDVGRTSEAFIA